MAEHTSGLVEVVDERLLYAGPVLIAGAYLQGLEGDDQRAEENARRLAACWNACAGISTETLEAGSQLTAVVDANRALLAACELALSLLDSIEVDSLRLKGTKPAVKRLKATIAAVAKARTPTP